MSVFIIAILNIGEASSINIGEASSISHPESISINSDLLILQKF
jgi:hypothetical protein